MKGVDLRGGWLLVALSGLYSSYVRAEGATADSPDVASDIEVRAERPRSSRGTFDVTVQREVLEASPRQRTSEMLSAAHGFFVDHEDGEGLGNDVTLRGFDLEHGSGIEMCLGEVPTNIPLHVRGSGYADIDFIIPEVVDSIRVKHGVYDPRQGDAAVAGSVDIRLGVHRRGTQLKATYGSFDQLRLLGVHAPRAGDPESFAAFALRRTDGFGTSRAGRSAGFNAQHQQKLSGSARLRLFAAAYAAETALAGVVREDDVRAGRIGHLDAYPFFAQNQGARSQRALLGAELKRAAGDGFEQRVLAYVSASGLRARQNYAGALETSQLDPSSSGRGDLFETTNRELAVGLITSVSGRSAWGPLLRISLEPGISWRAGLGHLQKNLRDPSTLEVWDRRLDTKVLTLDLGAYVDLEIKLGKLRLAGGPRFDFLARALDDAVLPPAALPASETGDARVRRGAAGIFVGPRLSAEYALGPELSVVAAYGEGFRSLDPSRLSEGNRRPYSRVRSTEFGLRARDAHARLSSSVAAFQTAVQNELVFVAEEGGLDMQQASVRRGVVAALLYRLQAGLLISTSMTVTNARYQTRVAGVAHDVPNVPPLLWRTDLAMERALGTWKGEPIQGHLSLGYTLAAAAHISDRLRGPTTHALAVGARLRRGAMELTLDCYNVLGLRAADSAERFVSNWSLSPGQQPASMMVHTVAAPPRTLVASLALYL